MDIQKYLKSLLRWWWLIVISTVIAAGASYYATQQQPKIYQSTTTLMVGQVIRAANPTNSDFYTTQQLAESYSQIVTRQPLLQATVESLGLPFDWQILKRNVYSAPLPNTQLLAVAVSDTNPERAATIADEIARQLILQSPTSPENQQRQVRGEFIQTQLDDLETRISAAKDRILELEKELDVTLSARKIEDIQSEISSLGTLITTWQANYTDLLTFLQGGDSPNYLSVIEPAQVSGTPVSPDVTTNVLLAAAVGFVLAFGAAILLEYLDDTVKSLSDLQDVLNITPLGGIMRVKGKNQADKLVGAHGLFSPFAESYRLVRTNLQFMAIDQALKAILITSPNPGEGKSTTVANLAMIMAQAELKTIVVDADLHKPTIHKLFGLSNSTGLTDLLRAAESDLEYYLKPTDFEKLHVLTSGPLPPNPAEILGSQRMVDLLNRLEDKADVIIIDSPPVLAATEAIILSNRVDGVLLVCTAKKTRLRTMKDTIERLSTARAHILGGVVNQVPKTQGYQSYSYSYGYHTSQPPTNPETGKQRRGLKFPVLK